ncbi:MAG: flavodoxin domain-containing protein [Dietzia sp.]
MNHPAVTFTSRYGSTRRYADALAERIETRAVDLASMRDASAAEPLVVLAPQYVTSILGRRKIIRAIRSAPGPAALVVVALSPADDSGRGTLAQKLVTASGREVAVFQLRGDFDPDRLRLMDRVLMAALRRELRKTPDEPMARLLLARERLEFVDESTLDPIVDWVQGRTTSGA